MISVLALSGNVLAEDVFVRIESVKGEVLVYLSDSGEDSLPIRVQAGDVLLAPLTIETGTDAIVEITVRGNTLSVSPDSSIVVDAIPAAEYELIDEST